MNDQLEQPPVLESPREWETKSPNARVSVHPAARVASPRQIEGRAGVQPRETRRTAFEDNEEDEDTFFTRHRGKLGFLTILAIGGIMAYLMTLPKSAPAARKMPERVVTVNIPPPPIAPPPPPPPPKVQPPPEEKMIEQTPVEEEPKPEPKAEEAPPALGTGIKGDGPGLAGLGSKGDGMRIGGNGNGSGRGGGRWDGYARQLQNRIAEEIRTNKRTRSASIRTLQVRIWVDATGRVNRAKLVGSTGDSGMDAALANDVLTGLQLREPPPQGMPSPIVLRVSARRP